MSLYVPDTKPPVAQNVPGNDSTGVLTMGCPLMRFVIRPDGGAVNFCRRFCGLVLGRPCTCSTKIMIEPCA